MSKKGINWLKIIGVSAGIITSLIIYANYRGAFDSTVSASTTENTKKIEVLDDRVDLVEKDNINLNAIVPRIEEKFDDFRHEQRKHNDNVLKEIRSQR